MLMSLSTFAQGPELLRALESPSQEEYDQDYVRPAINADDITKAYNAIQVKLYPNPTSDNRTLLMVSNMMEGDKDMGITLMDPFGNIISQRKLKYPDDYLNIPIGELDRLNPGIYYVKVTIDGFSSNKKLIVE